MQSECTEGLVLIRDGVLMIADGVNKILETTEPKEETKPTVDKSAEVAEYNPENIPWVSAEGEKGIYQKYPAYQQKPAMLTDYINLLEDLTQHNGKLQKAGFFYWKFPDGSTIGRKPAKKK